MVPGSQDEEQREHKGVSGPCDSADGTDIGSEVELADKNLKMSVKCPMTLQLMTTAVRGELCTHLECFNLESWVATNAVCKVRKWRCPSCGKKSFNVVIDALWTQIIEEAHKVNLAHEVEVRPDGSFRIIDFNESKSGLGNL